MPTNQRELHWFAYVDTYRRHHEFSHYNLVKIYRALEKSWTTVEINLSTENLLKNLLEYCNFLFQSGSNLLGLQICLLHILTTECSWLLIRQLIYIILWNRGDSLTNMRFFLVGWSSFLFRSRPSYVQTIFIPYTKKSQFIGPCSGHCPKPAFEDFFEEWWWFSYQVRSDFCWSVSSCWCLIPLQSCLDDSFQSNTTGYFSNLLLIHYTRLCKVAFVVNHKTVDCPLRKNRSAMHTCVAYEPV